jgi:hypothetical protein
VLLDIVLFSLDLVILPVLYSKLTHIKNVYLFSRKTERKGFTPFPVCSGTLPPLSLYGKPTQHFLRRSSFSKRPAVTAVDGNVASINRMGDDAPAINPYPTNLEN